VIGIVDEHLVGAPGPGISFADIRPVCPFPPSQAGITGPPRQQELNRSWIAVTRPFAKGEGDDAAHLSQLGDGRAKPTAGRVRRERPSGRGDQKFGGRPRRARRRRAVVARQMDVPAPPSRTAGRVPTRRPVAGRCSRPCALLAEHQRARRPSGARNSMCNGPFRSCATRSSSRHHRVGELPRPDRQAPELGTLRRVVRGLRSKRRRRAPNTDGVAQLVFRAVTAGTSDPVVVVAVACFAEDEHPAISVATTTVPTAAFSRIALSFACAHLPLRVPRARRRPHQDVVTRDRFVFVSAPARLCEPASMPTILWYATPSPLARRRPRPFARRPRVGSSCLVPVARPRHLSHREQPRPPKPGRPLPVFAAAIGLPFEIDVRLRERENWGDLTGETRESFIRTLERCDDDRDHALGTGAPRARLIPRSTSLP